MDIKNALEAYLQELNDQPQTDYKVASKIANLSIKVEELIKSINELESEGI